MRKDTIKKNVQLHIDWQGKNQKEVNLNLLKSGDFRLLVKFVYDKSHCHTRNWEPPGHSGPYVTCKSRSRIERGQKFQLLMDAF